jgi:hypothetical protein
MQEVGFTVASLMNSLAPGQDSISSVPATPSTRWRMAISPKPPAAAGAGLAIG